MMVDPQDGPTDVGTVADMSARIRSTLPSGWFPVSPPTPAPSATPVLDGLLSGLAQAWSFCYGLLGIVGAQARLGTASGGFLDMMSVDFFGSGLARRSAESDDSFRDRIRVSLISRRGTRQDVVRVLTGLTGYAPSICEPTHAADCGGYASASDARLGGGLGYGCPGLCYGSGALAFQYLLDVGTDAAFAPGIVSRRQGPASFIDRDGRMQWVSARVLRPDYRNGVRVGALLEARAFNLITGSRFWGGFAQSGETDATSWQTDPTTSGVFVADPVMKVSTATGMRTAGPSVDVAAGGSSACGAVWILVAANSSLSQVELVLTDLNQPGSSIYAGADMALRGRWQRISATIRMQPAAGKNLRAGLLLSGSSDLDAVVFTQCWQVEPGEVATSYIPTAGTLGIRAQDDVSVADPAAGPIAFTVADVLDTVASTIPAATIAWTTVAPPFSVPSP